jgi:hypothetical protein
MADVSLFLFRASPLSRVSQDDSGCTVIAVMRSVRACFFPWLLELSILSMHRTYRYLTHINDSFDYLNQEQGNNP